MAGPKITIETRKDITPEQLLAATIENLLNRIRKEGCAWLIRGGALSVVYPAMSDGLMRYDWLCLVEPGVGTFFDGRCDRTAQDVADTIIRGEWDFADVELKVTKL